MLGTKVQPSATDISPWKPYLDQMGPKTRQYVEVLVANLEFGRGVLGSAANLQNIARISQYEDDLGPPYVGALLEAPVGTARLLGDENTIGAIGKGRIPLNSVVKKLKAGDYGAAQKELQPTD